MWDTYELTLFPILGITVCFFCPLASDQCDWPDSVDCNFNPEKIKLSRRLADPTYLYLTFDDGPNEGTPNVLKALQVPLFLYLF